MQGPLIGKPQTLLSVLASTNNIPTAYSSAAGSQLSVALPPATNLCVYNATATDIAIATTAGAGGSSAAVDNFAVKAGTTLIIPCTMINTSLYIRSLSGSAISALSVYVSLW